jgi:hypothetical protein
MGHVDALRRHVGSVAHGDTLDRENILKEQEKNAFCKKQTPGTYHSRKEFTLDSDGILYRRRLNGNHLVVPATLVKEVMKENHATVYTAHPGTKRNHELIALQYWWEGMRKAIEEYVRSCGPCQITKKISDLNK